MFQMKMVAVFGFVSLLTFIVMSANPLCHDHLMDVLSRICERPGLPIGGENVTYLENLMPSVIRVTNATVSLSSDCGAQLQQLVVDCKRKCPFRTVAMYIVFFYAAVQLLSLSYFVIRHVSGSYGRVY
jgi:hypothetical protein